MHFWQLWSAMWFSFFTNSANGCDELILNYFSIPFYHNVWVFQYRVVLILSPPCFLPKETKPVFTCLTISIKIVSLQYHLFFLSCSPVSFLPCFADYTSTQSLLLSHFFATVSNFTIFTTSMFSPINICHMSKGKHQVLAICKTQFLLSTLPLLFHLFFPLQSLVSPNSPQVSSVLVTNLLSSLKE